jgi:hypothetical protein
MIRKLLEEIERSVRVKLFRVGLLTALTVPDIAGALDSEDGIACRKKYERWFDEHISPKYFSFGDQLLTGMDCYQYRCVLLHQGRTVHTQSRYSKTMFLFTKQANVAGCGTYKLDQGQTLAVDIPKFCHYMVYGAYEWLDQAEDTPRFTANMVNTLKLFQLSFGE